MATRERLFDTQFTPPHTASHGATEALDLMAAARDQLPWRIVADDESTVAELSSLQGCWTEALYLKLTARCNRLIEFTDGHLDVLPMPTTRHQAILKFLFLAFHEFVGARGGAVFFAPLRLRIRAGKFREPDLLLLLRADDPRRQNDFWLGADLVVEVTSPGDVRRDTVDKRLDYAEAAIPEYWIVDPQDETVTVLTLVNGEYEEHGIFNKGESAACACLPDFSVVVLDLFAAE